MQRSSLRYALFVFGFGFVLISLMPLLIVVQSIRRSGLGADAFIGAWMMSMFLGVGIAVLFLALHTFRSEKKEAAVSASSPDQPWRWRDDWMNKEVVDSLWLKAWFHLGFAGVVSYVICGACFVFVAKRNEMSDAYSDPFFLWWALSLLLVAAICMVVAAFQEITSARKWGESRLEFQRVPTGLGEPFVGRIWLETPLSLDDGVRVTIRCKALVTYRHQVLGREMGQKHAQHAAIWSDTRWLLSFLPTGASGEVCIPVAFDIPSDLPGTHQQDMTEWKLEIRSRKGWNPYSAEFEIPIFGITRKNEVATESVRTHSFADCLEKPSFEEMVADRNGIVISNTPGRLEIDFGMADRKQAAVVVIAGAAIASVFFCFSHFMFVAGAMIVLGATGEALATTRIILDDTHLHRRRAVFGIGFTQSFQLNEIESFTSTIEAEPNKTSKCVRITTKKGKTHTVIDRIADHAIGSVIAERFSEHVG